MRLRLSIQIVLCMLATTFVNAQDWRTCPTETFRDKLQYLVSQGNLQYDRSYRQGIKLYADSLQQLLSERQAAATLEHNDSIEFWAQWHKLWGNWYYEDGNYSDDSFIQSEKHFNEALQIFRQHELGIFETKVSAVPVVHRDLAQLCYRLKRYDEALNYTQKAYDIYDTAINNCEYGPEDKEYNTYLELKTQLAICNARLGNTELALKQINSLVAEFTPKTGHYYEALRKKGKILMLLGGKNCATQALPLYKEYLQWRIKDAINTLRTMTADERQGYWMRIRPFVADCYQLEKADPSFLYDVTLFAKGLLLQINRLSGRGIASEKALASLKYNWRQIQQRLTNDACAIEFVQYEKDNEQKMAALVLKKTGTPQWVEMMSPEETHTLSIGGKTLYERLSSTNGSEKNMLYQDSLLIRKLWNDTLVDAIGKSKKVYFAPDGYLHQLAIEYMPAERLAHADFYRLTSTRRLMENDSEVASSALIIGGVRYDAPDEHSQSLLRLCHGEKKVGEANDAAAYSYMRNIGATFNYLPGSKRESDSIYIARHSNKDMLLTGADASEQSFRKHCASYPVISISTHGYFYAAQTPQGTDLKPCLTDESLSQSILALAGANVSIADNDFNVENVDGILSARELSEMNLSDTRLAVLSACQTGLGYITADGVYGIQRGLKNAGVRAMLVSLWDVDDKATCQLMSLFHRNIISGMSYHKAFTEARRCLIQTETAQKNRRNFGTTRSMKAKATHPYNKPQYSNSFILIDAIN